METQRYETSDIALASYLFCSGIHLLSIDRSNERRATFIFEAPHTELILRWQAGTAVVNALAFYNAYQALKFKVFRGD